MDIKEVCGEIANGDAALVDVREQAEWDAGHLRKARLFPLSRLAEGDIPDDLPQDKTIYLHCRKGGRAAQAAQILKERYPNAVALKFGYDELKAYL